MKLQHTLVFLLLLGACEAYEPDDITLGPLPAAPEFRVEVLADDPNYVVVEDLSQGFFSRTWTFPGGTPERSTEALDTIFYRKAGQYTITLHAAAMGGNGTASQTQTVTIAQDAATACTDEITLLAGGCEAGDGKCWTFTNAQGAVKVGPTPGSAEWYTSPADGLQAAQYDDRFCFYFEGNRFVYANNGQTIDPWNGYVPVNYNPPTNYTFTLIPGGGENGELRVELPEGAFMGVWDAGNIYDIVSLTETRLVVRTPFLNGGGWFELTFVSE